MIRFLFDPGHDIEPMEFALENTAVTSDEAPANWVEYLNGALERSRCLRPEGCPEVDRDIKCFLGLQRIGEKVQVLYYAKPPEDPGTVR